MRNRTLVYILSGVLVIGAHLAALSIVVRNQSAAVPQWFPSPTPSTPPPTPVILSPWSRAVSTEFACLSFGDVQVNTSTGVATPIDQSGVLATAGQNGRSQSPDGRHELYQEGRQLFFRSGVSRPVRIDVESDMPLGANVVWSPDTHYVVVGMADRVYILDAASQERVATIPLAREGMTLQAVLWSPDNTYLALVDYEDVHIWSAGDGQVYEVPMPPEHVLLDQVAWSPQGGRFAYLWATSGLTQAFVSIYTPGEDRQARFSLPLNWIDRMDWSPDGRWLAVQQQAFDWDYEHTVVHFFGVDGTALQHAIQFRRAYEPSIGLVTDRAIWTADPGLFLWSDWALDETYTLGVFRLNEQSNGVIEIRLLKPPAYAPDGRHAAVYAYNEDHIEMDIYDPLQDTYTPFIERADAAGNPTWSPDGRYVAAVWATGQGGARRVFLSWMRADGANPRTLDDGFWDVRDLVWLKNREVLAYVAWRHAGYSLETVNLSSGETRILVEGLDERPQVSYEADRFKLMWREGEVTTISAYDITDGESAYVLHLDGINIPDRTRVFLSPDGHTSAVKTASSSGEKLQLAGADGSWNRTVRSELYGLGDPLWSPDGTMVTFTQAVDWGLTSLEVVTAGGDDLWRTDAYGGVYWNLIWQRCG